MNESVSLGSWDEHVKKCEDIKLNPEKYADEMFIDEDGRKYYMFFIQKTTNVNS